LRNPTALSSPAAERTVSFADAAILPEPVDSATQVRDLLLEGMRQERRQQENCVDLYYRAATGSWEQLESLSAAAADPRYRAAWRTYHESLARLLASGLRFGRLDPRSSLRVCDEDGCRAVPIVYCGIPWRSGGFCQLLLANSLPNSDVERYYAAAGVGVAMVAVCHSGGREPFYPPRQYFPVTAVLRSRGSVLVAANGDANAATPGGDAVLEFHNPCLFDSVRVGGMQVAMERDLSAPFTALMRDTPRSFTEGFLDPDMAAVKPELFVLEPYQRGKIPVVLIHGLWSDDLTWIDAINDLRAQADLYRQYQFWCFRYPTGRGLLESAAELREMLQGARESFDPGQEDPALERMVLIGHSMGGLVARLQVSYSYDTLWQHAARGPLEAVRTTDEVRQQLRRALYFDPSPSVSRVVFIGTPHRGAASASRCFGRLASSLVESSGPEVAIHRQLMDDNRDLFAEYLWKSWPTSVDLLEPSHPFLHALACMPYDPRVRLHTIIGTGGLIPGSEPSDGVVPISSARQAGTCSERFVPVRHERLLRDPAAVAEIGRILREHAAEAGA
jgi:pimeloyl-ACP methyl ester carboxylesterase